MNTHPEPQYRSGQAWGYALAFYPGVRPSEMLRIALEHEGISLRFNVRNNSREIQQGNGAWLPVTNRLMSAFRVVLQEKYGVIKSRGNPPHPLKWGNPDWNILIENFDAANECDPFKLWLEDLPLWDGEERIDFMLSNLYTEHRHASRNSLTSDFGRWASRFPFIAAVQMAYYPTSFDPADQIDTRPMFVGGKGIGKSKMLRSLLPPDQPDWFSGGFVVSNNMKQMVEQTMGLVICECAELAGLSRGNLKTWMAFSTSKGTRIRLAYRQDAENYIQRAVLIATTNDLRCIPSSKDGWRRDLPILLGAAPRAVEPWINANRDQLWAEALMKVQSGTRAGIPFDMREKAAEHTEQFRRRHDLIEDAVASLPQEFDALTTTELLIKAGVAANKQEVLALNPHAVNIFVDRLFAYECEQVTWHDLKGRKQRGWQRSAKKE